jgi:hypothetical protein
MVLFEFSLLITFAQLYYLKLFKEFVTFQKVLNLINNDGKLSSN